MKWSTLFRAKCTPSGILIWFVFNYFYSFYRWLSFSNSPSLFLLSLATHFSSLSLSLPIYPLIINSPLWTSLLHTVCPGSSGPFYIVTYNIKWVTTSWTYCTFYIIFVDNLRLKINFSFAKFANCNKSKWQEIDGLFINKAFTSENPCNGVELSVTKIELSELRW